VSGTGTNFIAAAFGMKRSGKSFALDIMARGFPRRIVADFIGEYHGKIEGAKYVHSIAEAVDALQLLRKGGSMKWTVVCVMQPEEILQLLGVLAPIGKRPETSFSYAVGGVVLQCGEIQLIAPNQGLSPAMANIIAMGRHYRVSILGAARRPREVNRNLTSQSDALLAFRQHEPRDADYLGDVMRSDVPQYLRQLRPFHHLRFLPNFGALDLVGPDGDSRRISEQPMFFKSSGTLAP
jgi:hypothetical protein